MGRYRARHPTSFDVEKQEFLCPLCRSLSNSVVPLIPQYHLLQQPTTVSTEETSQNNEESAEGVAAVVEQCDAMETTEELPPSPTQQEPTLAHEEEELEELGVGGEAMMEGDEGASANHTAVATTVTVVSSPSPSSTSSSTTELASAQSLSSDSTFMSVEEGPKETFADTKLCEARSSEEEPNKAQRNPLNINIDFSQWLEALFIALKYRRGISKEPSQPPNSGESQPEDAEPEPESLPTLTRFYTCPLDQVVEELDQLHHDGASFSRLYMVEEGCELSFNSSVYEIMNSFSQTTYRVGLEGQPGIQDERIPLMVWQSCAFTVKSIVVSAMESEKPLFGSLSSRQNDCLSTFIRFCGVVGSNFGEPKVIRSHSLKLISTLVEADAQNPSLKYFCKKCNLDICNACFSTVCSSHMVQWIGSAFFHCQSPHHKIVHNIDKSG